MKKKIVVAPRDHDVRRRQRSPKRVSDDTPALL